MKKWWNWFREKMDDYQLKKKMYFLYVFCVLVPLLVTDSVIIYNFIDAETSQQEYELENIANAVQYRIYENVEPAARIARAIYTRSDLDEFLVKRYPSELEYYIAYQNFLTHSWLDELGADKLKIKLYADNNTLVNGGIVSKVDAISETEWYQYMKDTNQEQYLYFYYENSNAALETKRKAIFVRTLDFYKSKKMEKLVTFEINYSQLVKDLAEMNYQVPIFICKDNKILFSNDGHSDEALDYESFELHNQVVYTKNMNLYGLKLQIYILKTEGVIEKAIVNNLPIWLLLLTVNIILPQILVTLINHSITTRIRELGEALESVNDEKLMPIEKIRGRDEIGNLMRNYNRMVARLNDLIQAVYKDKLREQEMDIARQKAELLALQSQINPHFMFNALESIRMHSILKKEYETADMVGKLATMERQNVEWNEDSIEIQKEMEFVKAYLGLQKYRFGDRLSYHLEIDKECKDLKIPRLTIVTFVENACIHGIESKITPGWIFVRVYCEQENLYIEIEDTGNSMDEHEMRLLREKMNHASIELLKKQGRVGIVNACLRLKMITNYKVTFLLEGEKGIGTMVQIIIPLDSLER